jgi:hypothetical protein
VRNELCQSRRESVDQMPDACGTQLTEFRKFWTASTRDRLIVAITLECAEIARNAGRDLLHRWDGTADIVRCRNTIANRC